MEFETVKSSYNHPTVNIKIQHNETVIGSFLNDLIEEKYGEGYEILSFCNFPDYLTVTYIKR